VFKWVPGEGTKMFYKYVFVIKENIGHIFSARFTKKSIKTVGASLPDVIEALIPGTYEPLETD